MDAARLPSVDAVLRTEAGRRAAERHGHKPAAEAIRAALADARQAWQAGQPAADAGRIAAIAEAALERAALPSPRPVFNLTGTVLHTNLGRALLAEAAIAAAVAAMRDPSALEFDLETGRRGERDDHFRARLAALCGAEDAAIVNNNAAALLLALSTLARGKEAVVSRGELIEIGGSFRLPEIMRQAGTRLIEVGTTNRTHARDYEVAIGPKTGLLMKVHPSNFAVQGFTKAVPHREVAQIARAAGLPFLDDLGSGTLLDLTRFGLKRERSVQDAIADGADLVTFSGDKLLGGPQAGLIVGRRDLIARLNKNHLKRALRIDKIRLAAFAATLDLYADPDRLAERLPTLRHFTRKRAEIAAIAGRLAPVFAAALGAEWQVDVADCVSQIGSGALPLDTLESAGLALRPAGSRPSGRQVEALAARLRQLPRPILGRIAEGALILDFRTLDDPEALAAAIRQSGTAP